MDKLVIGSIRNNAGKTSLILGLAKSSGKNHGYMKPFGDRLLYKKKRLWDYDSALAIHYLSQDDDPESVTLGLEHSKLRYMYDEETTKEKLKELSDIVCKGKDGLLVEAGKDITYGASVYLDAISIAKALEAELLFVLSGSNEIIMDDVKFIKESLDLRGAKLKGVIINKIQDVEDFKNTYLVSIEEMGVNVLGIVPFVEELSYVTVGFVSEILFAKVLAGEAGLQNVIKHVFVGAMTATDVINKKDFRKEDKLIITSGDRSDMILAAIESGSAGIVLTNNVLPPSNIISKAEENGVPLMLVSTDTFQTAKAIDDMEKLITKEEDGKFQLLQKLAKEHIKL